MTAQRKLKKVAHATRVEPGAEVVSLPSPLPKRGRGRPRKTSGIDISAVGNGSANFDDAKKMSKDTDSKALIVFRRAIADAEKAMMTPEVFELLAFSSLKEIGIYEGILLDKSLVLQGQPNVIIGNDDRSAMASVLPRLMQELHRRKLIASTSQTVGVG